MRAEGLAELAGDVVITCTGGVPTVSGQTIPAVNIDVNMNVPVTSRVLTPGWTEALLFLDEPSPSSQRPCQAANGICPATGGATAAATIRNVYQGQSGSPNGIRFPGIPLDPPGPSGTRTIRLTNFRLNASNLGSASTAPSQAQAFVTISGSTSVPLANPQVIVGFVQPGLVFSLREPVSGGALASPAALSQCSAQNATRIAFLRFQENFASAFKRRTAAAFVDLNTAPAPVDQASLGAISNTESGFYNSGLVGNAARGNLGIAGLADSGTRLQAVFDKIPAGVTLLVDAVNVGAGSTRAARLTNNEAGAFAAMPASGPVALPVVGGRATAVWEVLADSAASIQQFDFGVYVTYSAGAPGAGTPTAGGTLAPTLAASGTAIPRAVDSSLPASLFSIAAGTCAPATLSASPASLTFSPSAAAGAQSQAVKVTDFGTSVAFTATPSTFSGGNWLSVSPSRATTAAVLSVTVNPAGLAPGSYLGSIALATLDGITRQTITVSLRTGAAQDPDRLVVGSMTLQAFTTLLRSLPLPSSPDQKYCAIQILKPGAPTVHAWVYVPTAAERNGDFSSFGSPIIDPIQGSPFPGNIIPASRLAGVWAYRIAPAGPTSNEPCQTAPAGGLPQFSSINYVTGRAASDQITTADNPVVSYLAGSSLPKDQQVRIVGGTTPLTFRVLPGVAYDSGTPVPAQPWLSFSPDTAQTPAVVTMHFRPALSLLGPGTYRAGFTAFPLGVLSSGLTVYATLTVTVPPTWLRISRDLVPFFYNSQDPTRFPASETVRILSLGSATGFTVRVTIVSPVGVNWLTVTPTSGNSAPTDLTLTTNPALLVGMGRGTYLAFVDIIPTNPAVPRAAEVAGPPGAPLRVEVTANVSPAPDFTYAPSTVTFDFTPGGTVPQAQEVRLSKVDNPVQDPSGVPFTVRAAVKSPVGVDWLKAAPDPTAVGGPPILVSIDANVAANAPAGEYKGAVTVSSSSSTGEVIPVFLSVAETAGGGGGSGGGGGAGSTPTQLLAHIADGAGWKTTVILVNTDAANATSFTLRFFPGERSTPNAPLVLEDRGTLADLTVTDTIPAGGTVTLRTQGANAGPSWEGWAELTAPATVGGTAIFRKQIDAVQDSEGAVPLKSSRGSSFLLAFDNTQGFVTAMSLVNPSDSQPVTVAITLRDEAGNLLGITPERARFTLGARGHTAFALADRFSSTATLRGTIQFDTTSGDIAGLGLRFNPRFAFTSFETAPLPASAGNVQRIAHIVNSEGWRTAITILNTDLTNSNNVRIRFFNGKTTPADRDLPLAGASLSNSVISQAVAPGGSWTVQTAGVDLGAGTLWQGWAEVTSDRPVSGFAVFRKTVDAGHDAEGSVPLARPGSNRFVMPFDNSGGYVTAVAVVNPSPQGEDISAAFRTPAGTVLPPGGSPVGVLSFGHAAFALTEKFAVGGAAGSTEISAPNEVLGIGLRFNPRFAFTSLPVIRK